jgi:hypothetical protein
MCLILDVLLTLMSIFCDFVTLMWDATIAARNGCGGQVLFQHLVPGFILMGKRRLWDSAWPGGQVVSPQCLTGDSRSSYLRVSYQKIRDGQNELTGSRFLEMCCSSSIVECDQNNSKLELTCWSGVTTPQWSALRHFDKFDTFVNRHNYLTMHIHRKLWLCIVFSIW